MSMMLVNPFQAGGDGSKYFIPALTNPGAEAGDTSGWTNETGAIGVRNASPSPRTGSWYFYGGTVVSSIARQRVDLLAAGWTAGELDTGTINAIVSWYQGNYSSDGDNGGLGLRALDGSQVAIGADDYSAMQDLTAWVARSHTKTLPTLTRYVDILIKCVRTGGTNNDTYIDDISLLTKNY